MSHFPILVQAWCILVATWELTATGCYLLCKLSIGPVGARDHKVGTEILLKQ